MDRFHERTIDLRKSTTGQEIISAMQSIGPRLGLNYVSNIVIGDPGTVKVGFFSRNKYDDVAVFTGEKLDIAKLHPDTAYGQIAIKSSPWQVGARVPVDSPQRYYEEAVNRIAAALEERLR